MARVPPKGRSGPKLPHARMESARVELRLLGCKWSEIARATATPIGTLWRWYAIEDWRAIEVDRLARDPVVRRAKAVLAQKRAYELTKKNPDTALAERILALCRNGHGEGQGYMAHSGIVVVPLQDQGLESKSPTRVPMPPAPAAGPLFRQKSPARGKRRAAGPNE